VALSIEQWGWCLFFGFGTLLWSQIITSLPINKMPRCLTVGREVRDEDIMDGIGVPKSSSRGGDKVPTRGQILWIRSISRLQQQIRVVNAFRMHLDNQSNLSSASARSLRLRSSTLNPQNASPAAADHDGSILDKSNSSLKPPMSQ